MALCDTGFAGCLLGFALVRTISISLSSRFVLDYKDTLLLYSLWGSYPDDIRR